MYLFRKSINSGQFNKVTYSFIPVHVFLHAGGVGRLANILRTGDAISGSARDHREKSCAMDEDGRQWL